MDGAKKTKPQAEAKTFADLGFLVVRPPGLEPGTCGLRAAEGWFWLVPDHARKRLVSWANSGFAHVDRLGIYLWITGCHGSTVTTGHGILWKKPWRGWVLSTATNSSGRTRWHEVHG